MTLPGWLIKRTPKSRNIKEIRSVLDNNALHSVCESAMCPNIGECFSQKTMTFMILGNSCTRSCSFCAVSHNGPETIDKNEPQLVAKAAKKLNLKYVVITSVTRDDLPDGGAAHFAEVINAVKKECEDISVEVLIPDFLGNTNSLNIVLSAGPKVLNHNLETVERLYPLIRPQAEYKRSLNLLKNAKNSGFPIYTKSGIMLGLGETWDEVISLMKDLRNIDCDVLTIGQYLRPSKEQTPVVEYVPPEKFVEYEDFGKKLGFRSVFSGPFVRSSYKAGEINAF